MKRTLYMAIVFFISSAVYSQPIMNIKLGFSTRIMPTGYIDAGIKHFDFQAMATGGFETGMGFNSGLIIGWQPRAVQLYAGYGFFAATNKLLAEGSRPYPIAGFQWHDPYGRGLVDVRYMGDAIHLTFGVHLGKID